MADERILVVDRDPIEGQVTAYILRDLGKYQVIQATSGFEASRLVRSNGFDLVVLDTHLADNLEGIEVAELILMKLDVRPKPSIMMVTAEDDIAVLKKCASTGIREYILKPYPPRLLLERAKRLLRARRSAEESNQESDILETLNRIMDLPSLPEVLTKIQDLSEDPEVTAEKFGRAIALDPSITSKILRTANSAFFGLRREITSIKDAITLLGFETVQNVALTTTTFEILKGRPGSGDFDRLGFWQHSVGCGAIAKVLCSKLGVQRTDYFTAGVMHDMGKVILDAFLPRLFSTVLETASNEHIPILEAEKRTLGVTHAEIGQYVSKEWELPAGLVEAIAYHHTPGMARTDGQLTSLIHLSDVLCRRLNVGSAGDPFVPEIDDFARNRLGVSEATLEQYMPAMQQEILNARDLLPIGDIRRH